MTELEKSIAENLKKNKVFLENTMAWCGGIVTHAVDLQGKPGRCLYDGELRKTVEAAAKEVFGEDVDAIDPAVGYYGKLLYFRLRKRKA